MQVLTVIEQHAALMFVWAMLSESLRRQSPYDTNSVMRNSCTVLQFSDTLAKNALYRIVLRCIWIRDRLYDVAKKLKRTKFIDKVQA